MRLWVKRLKAYSLLFFDYNSMVLFFDYYYSRTGAELEYQLCNLDKYQIV